MTLSEAIAARIAADFPGNEHQAREILLRSLEGHAPSPNDEQTLLAVLQLADGDLARLAHYASAASVDFRDVIYWAFTPPDPNDPKTYEELRRRLGLPSDDEHTK